MSTILMKSLLAAGGWGLCIRLFLCFVLFFCFWQVPSSFPVEILLQYSTIVTTVYVLHVSLTHDTVIVLHLCTARIHITVFAPYRHISPSHLRHPLCSITRNPASNKLACPS